MVLREMGDGDVAFANAIANKERAVLEMWRREYILEELGVTTSLLDTLQLSIGLFISVSKSPQSKGSHRVGSRFATSSSAPSQHNRNIPSS